MYYHYIYLHSLAIPYNSNIFVIVHELFFVAYQSKQDRSVLLALLTWYKVVTPSISNSIHFILEILPSQETVCVSTMLSVIHSFLSDLQILSSAFSIIITKNELL